MPHNVQTIPRGQRTEPEGTSEAEVGSGPASPALIATGAIPAVDTAAIAPRPTASEQGFGPAKGPGVVALEALLQQPTPEPSRVVELVDAHRNEHAAMFALIDSTLGPEYVARVQEKMDDWRGSLRRREVVAGDPNNGGHFMLSRRGASWSTPNGGFTGTAGPKGLDTSYKLDEDDTLGLQVKKDKTGTLAWKRDGKNQGELFGGYQNSSDYQAGVRVPWELGDKSTLTTGLRHSVTDDDSDGSPSTNNSLFASHVTPGGRTIDAAIGARDGMLAASAGGSLETKNGTFSGSVAYDARGTTAQLAATHVNGPTSYNGTLTRGLDQTELDVGAEMQRSPQQVLAGSLKHVNPDQGPSQTTLALSERYRSEKLVRGLNLEVGSGASDYVKGSGSVEAQFDKRVYGGAWAAYDSEGTSELGASLTFTPSEKTALTLAGVLDQDGALEARMQLDVFKKKISSVSDLSDQKKNALVSVFLSYSQDGDGNRRLDQRFGAPQATTPAGEAVTAGIRIRF